eukprot:scaffold1503_cov150-Ochromonas_danica.AAC.17
MASAAVLGLLVQPLGQRYHEVSPISALVRHDEREVVSPVREKRVLADPLLSPFLLTTTTGTTATATATRLHNRVAGVEKRRAWRGGAGQVDRARRR